MKPFWPDLQLTRGALLRAILVMTPIVGLAAVARDSIWLQASIITMSTFIGHERSGVASLGVLLHGGAIVTVLAIFLATEQIPILFAGSCALIAMMSVRLTFLGSKLRSLGNFTFIPALYLAAEAVEAGHGNPAESFVTYLLPLTVSIVPTLVLAIFTDAQDRPTDRSRWRHYQRLLRPVDHGARRIEWAPIVAVGAAVFAAAALVEIFRLDHGQWVIWSAASVVTGEAATARSKLRDRCIGAIIGVPLGLAVGLAVPHNDFFYGASIVAALLTLVAFRSYIVGFGARCTFVALAIAIAGGGAPVAAERAENVVFGGLIGMTCVLGVAFLERRAVGWRGVPTRPEGIANADHSQR